MNSKGQIAGFLPYILIGIIIVFVFAIFVVPIAYSGDKVFDELKKTDNLGSSNTTVDQIEKVQDFMIPGFDQLVFFILIGIFIGVIVLAIFTDFHPVLLVLLILVFILLIVIGGLFSNVYDEVADNSQLQNTSSQFNLTNTVMGSSLPVIITILGVISIIIILAKRGGQTSPV